MASREPTPASPRHPGPRGRQHAVPVRLSTAPAPGVISIATASPALATPAAQIARGRAPSA
jgi:hypothetical protein